MPVVDPPTTTTSNIIDSSSLTTTTTTPTNHESHQYPTTTTTTATTIGVEVDPSIRQLAQKLQQRRSFKSSHSHHHSTTTTSSSNTTLFDPIVAPGFGTRRDCARLARELSSSSSSIDVDTVQYLMERRGRGVVPQAAEKKTAVWDDFMKEAGMTTTSSSNDAVVTGKRGRGGSTTTTSTTTNANGTTASSSQQQRTYDLEAWQLPSVPTKSTKKTKLDTTTTTAGGGGLLLQTGTMDVSLIARKNDRRKLDWTDPYTLSVPTILPMLPKMATVVTAGHACHMLALSTTGSVYGWGRNEQCQLGAQFGKNVYQPTLLLEEQQHNDDDDENVIVQAAVGKAHTILLTARGQLMACGSNKSGQCAISGNTDVVGQFRPCVVVSGAASPTMRAVACGEDFSIALDTDGYMYSAGSSEYGQLGNGETGQYFVAANKLAFANAQSFTKRTTFCHAPNEKIYGSSDTNTKVVPLTEDIRIQQVVCGKHHSIALEANTMPNTTTTEHQQPRVFTWGCGDYGVLGHGIQADEYYPRNVGALANLRYTTTLTSASEIRISAGQHCSLLQTSNGHVYYWGKHRSVGEATMRPSLIDALANNGHVVTQIGAGGQTVVCATQHGQTVAWGQGMYGELGFGMDKKSSSKPSFVEGLEGCHILSLACGYGTTLFVVRDDETDQKVTAPLPRLDASVLEALAAEAADMAADDDEEETDQAKPKGRKGKPKK